MLFGENAGDPSLAPAQSAASRVHIHTNKSPDNRSVLSYTIAFSGTVTPIVGLII